MIKIKPMLESQIFSGSYCESSGYDGLDLRCFKVTNLNIKDINTVSTL